jgi:nucleoside-diphosphate-sugar epimerase/choline dehydrogenase-like flavoprotein
MLIGAHALNDDPEEADVCIVGGGAVGLTIAADLIRRGARVIVLEAGGEAITDESQAFLKGEVAEGSHHWAPDHYRVRALGGASLLWGGRSIPYDPIDFERRPWVPHSGWPVGYEEIAPWYGPAMRQAEAGDFDQTPSGPIVPGLESRWLHTTIERFSRPTNFRWRYHQDIVGSGNGRVILNAPVTAIRLATDGSRVDHLEMATPGGHRRRVRARDYVICAGGLENARLLLASDDVMTDGIGAAGGWLGRGYMCHMAATFGEVALTGPAASIGWDYERDADGVYIRRRLALTEAAQRELELLNFTCRLHILDAKDPAHHDPILSFIFLAAYMVKYEYSRENREADRSWPVYSRHLANVARDPLRLANFIRVWGAKRYLQDRRIPSIALGSKTNRYPLEFHSEQAPNRDSRVMLSDERDPLGMRRLKIDWRPTALDFHTLRESYRLIGRELERTGTGRLSFDDAALEAETLKAGAYGGHHTGTTRMSASPAEGVVDTDCRVHGVHNLFVGGCSVLPTSSQANPTLTALAVGLRLADHLARRWSAALPSPPPIERPTPMSNPGPVLVTGASGFVGKAVARRLAAHGLSVRGGVRALTDRLRAEPFTPVVNDVTAPSAAALEGVRTVVHCAVGAGADTHVTIEGTRAMLAAAKAAGASHFIFISSVAVYSATAGAVDEDSATDHPQGDYGRSKLEAEALCRAASAADFAVTLLRPTQIHGPRSQQWTSLYIDRLRTGAWRALGVAGEGRSNLIYIDDLCDFIETLVRAPPEGVAVFNVNGADTPSWNSYLERLNAALALPPLPPPSRAGRYEVKARTIFRKLSRAATTLVRKLAPPLAGLPPFTQLDRFILLTPSSDEVERFGAHALIRTDRMRARGFEAGTSVDQAMEAVAAWEKAGRPS